MQKTINRAETDEHQLLLFRVQETRQAWNATLVMTSTNIATLSNHYCALDELLRLDPPKGIVETLLTIHAFFNAAANGLDEDTQDWKMAHLIQLLRHAKLAEHLLTCDAEKNTIEAMITTSVIFSVIARKVEDRDSELTVMLGRLCESLTGKTFIFADDEEGPQETLIEFLQLRYGLAWFTLCGKDIHTGTDVAQHIWREQPRHITTCAPAETTLLPSGDLASTM